jgi:hypothetical protein
MLASIVVRRQGYSFKEYVRRSQTPKEMKLLGKEDTWSSRSCRRILIYTFDSLWIIENREGAMALSRDSLASVVFVGRGENFT